MTPYASSSNWKTRLWSILLVPTLIAIALALILLPASHADFNCPSGTLISGPLDDGLVGLAMPIIILGLIRLGIAPLAGRGISSNHNAAIGRSAKFRSIGFTVAALLAVICGLGMWAQGGYSYYCATPAAIHLHPVIGSSHGFGWTDIRAVIPRCKYGRHGDLQVSVTYKLPGAQELHLIDQSGINFRQNYRSIAALLGDADFRYDTSWIDDCPPTWASFFAEQPR